jgi:hypothetical protein
MSRRGPLSRAAHFRLIVARYDALHRRAVPLLQLRRTTGTASIHCRQSLEPVMFAYLLEKVGAWFERAENARRDAWLASSADLAQLEQRMHSLETRGYRD